MLIGQELAHIEPQRKELSLADIMTMADVFVQSKYFADAISQAQGVVKILYGQELGLGPMASMQGIHIIKGKPSLGSGNIAALIKRSRKYDYKIVKLDDTECSIQFFENGQSAGPASTFSMANAKAAETQNVQKFPRNMLFARALTNGARWYCPDIFAGSVYTPDELGATVTYNEAGEIVNVETGEIPDDIPTAHVREASPSAPAIQVRPTATTAPKAAPAAAKKAPTIAEREAAARALMTKKGFTLEEVNDHIKSTITDDETVRKDRLVELYRAIKADDLKPLAQTTDPDLTPGAEIEEGFADPFKN